jgi:hypothetical protein
MNAPNTAVRTHTAAWYQKTQPTFSDAIDAVGCLLWTPKDFSMSRQQTESVVIPIQLLKRFVETLCLAAWIAESRAERLSIPDISSACARAGREFGA